MTLQEFYCCQVPRWLGSARAKIRSKTDFEDLTNDEIFALALWADFDVEVKEEFGKVVSWGWIGNLEIEIVDGRFTVNKKQEANHEDANDY